MMTTEITLMKNLITEDTIITTKIGNIVMTIEVEGNGKTKDTMVISKSLLILKRFMSVKIKTITIKKAMILDLSEWKTKLNLTELEKDTKWNITTSTPTGLNKCVTTICLQEILANVMAKAIIGKVKKTTESNQFLVQGRVLPTSSDLTL